MTLATTVALGANPNYAGDEYFVGSLADFALYARPMDAEEIRERFTAGRNLD